MKNTMNAHVIEYTYFQLCEAARMERDRTKNRETVRHLIAIRREVWQQESYRH